MSESRLHVRFGRFELDEDAFQLRRGGEPLPIERKPLLLLIYLVRNRHRVARRDELFEVVWPDAVVGDDALARAVLKAREALGEVGARERRVQTVRGVGFRFAGMVEDVPVTDLEKGEAAAPPPEGPRALLGREEELEHLRAALGTALGGSGRIALVAGTAGIGKSRVAEEIAAEAARAGAEVHFAWAWAGTGAPAFWLWSQVLRAFADAWETEALSTALGEAAIEIARVVPSLRDRLGLAPPAETEADEARFRLFDAIARFLARAAQERPQVLVLEDLHWADSASLQTLSFLADELRSMRLLVIGTYRDDEVSREHPLEGVLGDLERRDACERIVLPGLAELDVARLIEELTGFAPAENLARRLHERTGGNPFFVRQVVGLVAAPQHGDPSSLAEQLAAHLGETPSGVRRVVARRLECLSHACRSTLAVASAVGREFSFAWIARVSDLPRETLLAALAEAGDARLIEAVRGPERSYRFTHDVLQEAVYAELEEPRRLGLHQRLAVALEALHAGHLEPVVPALAYHYGEAGPLLEKSQAVDYAKWAGELARELLSYEEAVEHFGRALQALDLLPDANPARRAELLVCLGYAHQSAGAHERGREILREAAAVARSAGDVHSLAVAALGLAGLGIAVVDEAAVELMEEALAGLGEGVSFLQAWLQSMLAVHLANQPARRAEAEKLIERTEQAVRQLGEPRVLAYALASRAAVQRLSPTGQTEERLALLTEAAAVGARNQDLQVQLLARIQRFGALLELGDMSAIDAEYERIEGLLAALRSPYWHYVRPSIAAMKCLLWGRLDEAEALAIQAFGGPESPHLSADVYIANVIGMIRYEQGRLAELIPMLGSVAEKYPNAPALRAGLSLALLEGQRDQEARAAFEAIASAGFGAIAGTESWPFGLALLAEVCARLGDAERAAELFELLEPRAARCLIAANGHYCHGPAALYLAMLACTRSDWDCAERHLDIAMARSEALRAPAWRTRTLAVRARMHVERGDRSRGRRLAREALSVAEELGLERLRRELVTLAAS